MATTNGQKLAAADVLAKAKARTGRCRLVLDGDLLDEHAQLQADFDALGQDSPEAVGLAERIVALEDTIADSEVEFVFQGMGRGRWRRLIADHPPSDEQKAQGAEFDVDQFPFHAMAASLVDPAMTVEQLVELADEGLDEVQFSKLWGSCLKANIGSGATRPESRAAHALLANGRRNSEQPSDSASPVAS